MGVNFDFEYSMDDKEFEETLLNNFERFNIPSAEELEKRMKAEKDAEDIYRWFHTIQTVENQDRKIPSINVIKK